MEHPFFLQVDKSYQNKTDITKYQQNHAKKAVQFAQLFVYSTMPIFFNPL
jgi:hypothetical protein